MPVPTAEIFSSSRPAPARPRPIAAAVRRVAAEPFVHFILLGAVLFAVVGLVQRLHHHERYRIVLDGAALKGLAARWAQQYGSAPTAQQLDSLARSHVREEILYREGLDLRLDRDDEIVRRRLAQKVEFLLQDLAIAKPADEAALRASYEAHPERYLVPARATFTHVFFSPDVSGDGDAHRRAAAALAELQARRVTRAPGLGDRFPYLHDHAGVSAVEVARLFGETPFSAAAFEARPGSWSGPHRSGYGWHLLYVSDRSAPRLPPLADVAEQVRADRAADDRERANAAAFEKLRAKYDVTVERVEVRDAYAAR